MNLDVTRATQRAESRTECQAREIIEQLDGLYALLEKNVLVLAALAGPPPERPAHPGDDTPRPSTPLTAFFLEISRRVGRAIDSANDISNQLTRL